VVPFSEQLPTPTTPSPQQALTREINAYIAQPRFAGALWGISVVDLKTGQTLYAHHADKLFIPASNAKLYTAALALHTLGPRFRFRTSLYATRHPRGNGVLNGNMILYGGGDPSLGSGTDTQSPDAWADQLASALAARGVRRIHGNLIADATAYAGTPTGAGWEANDLESAFAPPISALSVQGNTFVLRIGGGGTCCRIKVDPGAADVQVVNLLHKSQPGVHDPLGVYRAPGSNRLYVFGSRPATSAPRILQLSIPDPALYAGELLVDALTRHGIHLDGSVHSRRWPQAGLADDNAPLVHISDVRSAPLSELVHHMLKDSDNLYAQLLLLAVGKQTERTGICVDQKYPPTTTARWGLCALRAFLRSTGLEARGVQFEEGSGLSRKDLVTPGATTALLAWVNRQRFAWALKAALPIAGVDGTLEYRLRGPLTKDNLRAKTGTLRFAYALSGYVTSASGARLAFSLMLNSYARPVDAMGKPTAPRARRDLDAIARMIAGYGVLPAPAPAASTAEPVQ
jgi:D-alanyl-D-alanine carboxypeptidase/D-alanyl-D-alanine-endopeptidase (penicillin-binding protein 4)